MRGDGTCRVVVGTLAFGLGVNKPDVRAFSIRCLKLLVYEAFGLGVNKPDVCANSALIATSYRLTSAPLYRLNCVLISP